MAIALILSTVCSTASGLPFDRSNPEPGRSPDAPAKTALPRGSANLVSLCPRWTRRDLNHPNLLQAQSDFDGKPHFSCQNAVQCLQFAGDQINTIEIELGALVSVFIPCTIDAGLDDLRAVVPRANLRFGDFAPITTLGIAANGRFSIFGPP